LQKIKTYYWQGWILVPTAPTLPNAERFCLLSILWSLFGEHGSGFFVTFAAINGT
jgi:hypothetical protein